VEMLTNYFKEILDNYLNSISNGKFNKNHEMFKLINYTTTNAVNEIVKKYNLITKGSSGAGGWTRYPWIAIYNDKITTTIQRGVYIVYLFSQDMSRVYLTLNQGCTNLKKELGTKAARDLMVSTRENIRSIIDNYNFNTDNELIIGNIDYEIGSIFYKEYIADEFPQEEEFIKDLEDMISVYEKYYKLIFLKGNESNSEIQLVHMGDSDVKDNIIKIESYIKSRGFIFAYEDLCNFYLSLKTKPLPFEDETFDLIFHPVSNCYIEDVLPVWKECYRVLKKGGILLAGLDNGINFVFDDDETRLVRSLPFNPLKDEELYRLSLENDWGIEFSHSIEEQIGGQLKAGFVLADIFEDTNGSGRLHELNVPTFYATKAIKI
jgi:SAM-dependent methyltransferase